MFSNKSNLLDNFKKHLTPTQQISFISKYTELDKKDIKKMVKCLNTLINLQIEKFNECNFLGLMKIKKIYKPEKFEKETINPFTGKKTISKSKPEREIIKIRPLKELKKDLKN